ncbi:aldo/keto reductase [Ornithinimicrobium sediminis]|uniref:aldo/keto reductase n=1 Tax=Ornithinimicrobium sediminis TaxID=2904603 RepID=UPI001E3C249F|nr:aldo/keto reductase [Ornithinimicrobium sediminis]MCE0487874.1 aldo/keto reductase [Ornithinimicrobium sediminis]
MAQPLTRRPLGDTGLSVTAVGIGTAALGRPGYLNLGHARDLPDLSPDGMREHTWSVLDVAYAAGVRHVDAARSYGRAEEFVAGWLDARGHADVVVTSKWGYTYVAGWRTDVEVHEVKDHTAATLRRQLAETRALLGGRLAAYQVHSATLESGVLEDTEVLAALTALADEGVVVGLSTSGPAQGEVVHRALDLAADGSAPFRTVQATWNPLEPSAGPALQRAADAGWGVMVKEGVANGRLTDRGDAPAPLRALAGALGTGLDALALAVALAQPFTSVVLSGAGTVEQLRDNLRALELELDGATVAAALAHAEDPAAYWSTRSELPWT